MPTKSTISFNPEPLQRARTLRGFTYAALAKRIGRSTTTVWLTLHGESTAASTVFRLCAELGVRTERVWR